MLNPKESANAELRSNTYCIDFDYRYWFVKRNPGVVAGGFATKEEAAKWLGEFITALYAERDAKERK